MTGYRTYEDSKGIRQTVWDLSTNYHSGNSAKTKEFDWEIEQDNGKIYYDDNRITAMQHKKNQSYSFDLHSPEGSSNFERTFKYRVIPTNYCIRMYSHDYLYNTEQKFEIL